MQKTLGILLLFVSNVCFSQTNNFVTEYYLANNHTIKYWLTSGTDNLIWMDCDDILDRYIVDISGTTSTGVRLPGQSQISDLSSSNTVYITNITQTSNASVGVYEFEGDLVVTSTSGGTVEFGLYLDFLSGTVPSGQTEARSAYVEIDSPGISSDGEGYLGDVSKTVSSGTTTYSIDITLTNDNWDDDRVVSSFRLGLVPVSNVSLTTAVSTSTNNSTFVASVNGVKTTYIDIASVTGGRTESGEMIYYSLTRESGYTYTAANGYKVCSAKETFDTGTSASTKEFIEMWFSTGTPKYNYTNDSYSDGDVNYTSMDLMTNTEYYARYYLRNESGSSATFAYTHTAYKYCEFNSTISYSQSISSLIPGGHILSVSTFSGPEDYGPVIIVYPGDESLSTSDTYDYEYLAHCPSAGYIRIYYDGSSTYLYDGDTYTYYYSEDRGFSSVGNTSDRARTTIGGDGNGQSSATITFYSADDYIEIVPVTSNVATNSNYQYKFGYSGAF